MNPVFRGFAIYIFLLILFRLMGKRSLKETTTFDFVLILIISEVTQQALVGQDYSITGALILIVTLVSADLIFTFLRESVSIVAQITEGAPLVIVDHGQPLRNRMKKCKVDNEDVMHAARTIWGIETMAEIKYAVLEKDGTISIIPYEGEDVTG